MKHTTKRGGATRNGAGAEARNLLQPSRPQPPRQAPVVFDRAARECACGCGERFIPYKSDHAYVDKDHSNRARQRRLRARGKLGIRGQREGTRF